MGSMFAQNPSPIQDPPLTTSTSSSPPIPLVLIHDGGGTIFSYYLVGDLGRAVYGIANPRYDTGRAWTGGIPEMARHYLAFVKAAVPSGPVILGGWSLGGLIALEVARLMAEDKEGALKLVGIVMVDSVCPTILDTLNGSKGKVKVAQHAVQWTEHTRQETKDKVMWCFAEAMRMLGEWKMPVWKGEGTLVDGAPPPPRVVLLRAKDAAPVVEEGVARVDVHREDPLLGWGGYQKDLITKVVDIPGHHYNIFHTDETLDATTEAIRRACLDLEGMSYGLGLA